LKDRCYLFGGSFDPPHRGHQELIRGLLQRATDDRISEIRIVPAAVSPFKQEGSHAGDEHRLAMLELMLNELSVSVNLVSHTSTDSGEVHLPGTVSHDVRASHTARTSPALDTSHTSDISHFRDGSRTASGAIPVYLDTFEMKQGGVSYTVLTVKYLQSLQREPVLVIGADNLYSLEKWKEHEYLLEEVPILVFRREGQDAGIQESREKLMQKYSVRSLEILDLCPPGCSSTSIRERLSAQSLEVEPARNEAAELKKCIPESVLQYIQNHGLYRGARAAN
tara:strand:+ start:40338 stop:41177 length:840 start_codon:yes stop_codon:yes gene_type:complete